MIVRITTFDGVQRVRFEGGESLDSGCAERVKRQCAGSVRDDMDVAVDLANIEFVDSAGLGVLIGLFKMAHRVRRRLLLVGVRPAVFEVMQVIRFDEIFQFADTFGEAVDRLRKVG